MNVAHVVFGVSLVLAGCECGGPPGADAGPHADATDRGGGDAAGNDALLADALAPDASVPASPEGLAEMIAVALCEDSGYLDRCFPEVFSRAIPCEVGIADVLTARLAPRWGESIRAGRVTFDPSAVGACVASLRTGVCDPAAVLTSGLTMACDELFIGSVASGASCLESVECVPGHACAGPSECAQTCQPLLAEGRRAREQFAALRALNVSRPVFDAEVAARPAVLNRPA